MGTFPQTMHRRTFTALLGLCGIGLLPGLAHAAEKVSGKTTSSFSQGLADIRPTNPIIKDGCFNISPRDFGSKISLLSIDMNIKDDFFQILVPEYMIANDGSGLIAVDFTAYEDAGAAMDSTLGIEGGNLACRVLCFPKEDYQIANDSNYAETPGVIRAFGCDDLDSGDSGYYIPYVLFLMALLFNPDMPDELPFHFDDENLIDYAQDISSRCSDDNMTQQEDQSIVTIETDSISYTLVYYDDSQTYRALVAVAASDDDNNGALDSSASSDTESPIGPKIRDGYFDISARELASKMESACHNLGRNSMSFSLAQNDEGTLGIRVDDSIGFFAGCAFLTPEGDSIQDLDPDESRVFKIIGIQLPSRSMLEDDSNSQLIVQVIAHVLDPSLTEDDVTEILREIDQDTEPKDNGDSKGHTIKKALR